MISLRRWARTRPNTPITRHDAVMLEAWLVKSGWHKAPTACSYPWIRPDEIDRAAKHGVEAIPDWSLQDAVKMNAEAVAGTVLTSLGWYCPYAISVRCWGRKHCRAPVTGVRGGRGPRLSLQSALKQAGVESVDINIQPAMGGDR